MKSNMVDTPEAMGKKKTVFVPLEVALMIEELEEKVEKTSAELNRWKRIASLSALLGCFLGGGAVLASLYFSKLLGYFL